MALIKVSATHARNNFFELLNQVAMGAEIVIEKDSKEVAILSPKKQQIDWKEFKKALKATHGILKDYDPKKDSPFYSKRAWGNFGKWDQGLKIKNK